MAAAPNDKSWIELQRRREQRMRFEVLDMVYRASGGKAGTEHNAWSFAADLGIWHAELFRVVEWLSRHDFVRYCGAGPVVCLTAKGVDFIEGTSERRRSIRMEEG